MMYLDLVCQCMTEVLYRSVTAMLEDKAFAQGRVCHRELLTSDAGLKLSFPMVSYASAHFQAEHTTLPHTHIRSRPSAEAWHCQCCTA